VQNTFPCLAFRMVIFIALVIQPFSTTATLAGGIHDDHCTRVAIVTSQANGSGCSEYRTDSSNRIVDHSPKVKLYWNITVDGRALRRSVAPTTRVRDWMHVKGDPQWASHVVSASDLMYESSIVTEYDNDDKIAIIKCLLELEGDSRLSAACFHTQSELSSLLWNGEHSVQMEALLLIRLLLCDPSRKGWGCGVDWVPELVEISNDRGHSTDGPVIEMAFRVYREWLEERMADPDTRQMSIDKHGGPDLSRVGLRWR
jgi:hypothetical protein